MDLFDRSTGPRPPSGQEKLERLRLLRSENVGPVTWRKLMARYGSAAKALEALPDLAKRGGSKRPIKVCPTAAAKREMDALEALGAQLVCEGEDDYPAPLAALEDSPPLFSVFGHPGLFKRPMVALVGSRNCSINGQRFAERLASDLGKAGLVVVSGLARGLDTAAHWGSVDSGTIAVLAGGVDVIFPPENADLYHRLAASGAIVSEMPPGEQPKGRHFPRRNRIISGLSLGVVVVEGAIRSGSMITGRLAGDQGREVMAVPGSPMDPRAQGPNQLIKDGAALIEGVDDVLRVLEPHLSRPMSERKSTTYTASPAPDLSDSAVDSARPKVLEALNGAPLPVDELIRRCQLSPSVVAMVLLELELAGRLARHPGNRVSLLATF
ncbi:MAG: DNA-processing protein DprA [Rhodospirillum sp.]|nr:DNA-processing protein DprA [Rhodospirillum sp.]MCF8491542.1 DNA-processing protein DprA [Rhodospirillum sp.]MCF8501561.1 DNA-processing protein DprA [Rhodospirillum sp.]